MLFRCDVSQAAIAVPLAETDRLTAFFSSLGNTPETTVILYKSTCWSSSFHAVMFSVTTWFAWIEVILHLCIHRLAQALSCFSGHWLLQQYLRSWVSFASQFWIPNCWKAAGLRIISNNQPVRVIQWFWFFFLEAVLLFSLSPFLVSRLKKQALNFGNELLFLQPIF